MRARVTRWLRRHPALFARLRRLRGRAMRWHPRAGRRPTGRVAVADWHTARPGIAVPRPLDYADIALVPARRMVYRNQISDGGPAWPDFDRQPLVRHLVHDRPVDCATTPPRRPGPRVGAPVIWGGRLIFHFGHLAAEHLNRIPAALYHRPEAQVAVTLPPGRVVADIPPWLWDMLAWYGVAPTRLLAVTRPVEARRLLVGPQPEHLGAHPPPGWFLDLLDELLRLNGLRPVPARLVYVTRQGQTALGNGGHAGEAALVRVLRRAGAVVIDPARLPLRAQLKAYAGAGTWFSPRVPVHGRQLLGRLDQHVLILNRRPGTRMVPAQLGVRCKTLTYAEPIAHFAAPRTPPATH